MTVKTAKGNMLHITMSLVLKNTFDIKKVPTFIYYKNGNICNSLIGINKGNIDLGAKEEEKAEQAKKKEEFKDLLSKVQNNLAENISEVRFTDRLVNTLACLVVNEHEMGANLEKIYQSANQKVGKSKRIKQRDLVLQSNRKKMVFNIAARYS